MNERLIELYRSCRPKEALASQDQFQSANALLGSEVEKFAELIVQECAMLVEGFILEQEVALDDYQEYEASAVLKEHFGVEE